jgi:ribosomal protein L29
MKQSKLKISELRAKPREELIAELEATAKELFSLRLQKGLGGTTASQAPRTHNFKGVRRKIAQIKTILNEENKRKV